MNEKNYYFSHGIEESQRSDLILNSILKSKTVLKSKGTNEKQSSLSVVYARLHSSIEKVYEYYKELCIYKYVLVFDLTSVLMEEPELKVKLIDYNYNVPNPPTLKLLHAYEIIKVIPENTTLPFIGIVQDFTFKDDFLSKLIVLEKDEKINVLSIVPPNIIKIIKCESRKLGSYDTIYSILTSIERNYYGDICDTYTKTKYTTEESINKTITKLNNVLSENIQNLDQDDKKRIIKFMLEFLNEIIPNTLEKYNNNPENSPCFIFNREKPDIELLSKKSKSVNLISENLIKIFKTYISKMVNIGIKCDYCQKPNVTFVCSKCKSSFYCNKKCQNGDWFDNHSNIC